MLRAQRETFGGSAPNVVGDAVAEGIGEGEAGGGAVESIERAIVSPPTMIAIVTRKSARNCHLDERSVPVRGIAGPPRGSIPA